MSTDTLLDIAQRVGWTLVHSLWQFAAIGLFWAAVMRCLHRRAANLRYLAGCAAMTLMAVTAVVTFATAEPNQQNIAPFAATSIQSGEFVSVAIARRQEFTDSSVPASWVPDDVVAEHDLDDRRLPQSDQHALADGLSENTAWTGLHGYVNGGWMQLVSLVDRWVVHLATIWFVGMIMLSPRPIGGWLGARRLRRVGTRTVSKDILHITNRLSASMGVRRAVSVVESTLVDVPTVIGCLRPLVLLPASALTGLSQPQLEAVIAHELAHVRRYDYVVNALQTIAETFFFYHPVVWLISRRIRIDREECCDDKAIGVTCDRAGYAKMLLTLDSMRRGPNDASMTPALSAAGGSLVSRIRRVLELPPPHPNAGPMMLGGVLSTVVTMAIVAVFLTPSPTLTAQNRADVTAAAPGKNKTTAEPLRLRILAKQADADLGPAIDDGLLSRYRSSLQKGKLTLDDDRTFMWVKVVDQDADYPIVQRWQNHSYVLACQSDDLAVSWTELHGHLFSVNTIGEQDPLIEIEFDDALTDKIRFMTAENIGNQLAIIFEAKVVSAPRIQSIIYRKARLTGRFTQDEAARLRTALATAVAEDVPNRDSHGRPRKGRAISDAGEATSSAEAFDRGDESITTVDGDPWFRPDPLEHLDHKIRFGRGRQFVQVAADSVAQSDLKTTDRQRSAIEDIRELFDRGGPDGVMPQTSKQRQDLWNQARSATETVLTADQIARVDQLLIQRSGYNAFRDPDIIAELKLTDEQRESINTEIDVYRKYSISAEENWVETSVPSPQFSDPDEFAAWRQRNESRFQRREQLKTRQLWDQVRQTLTADQRKQFNQLRGRSPDSTRATLDRLNDLPPSAMTVLGRIRTETNPVALSPPVESEIVEAWLRRRTENGQPRPSPTEILNARYVCEKIVDFCDPPRNYPLLGVARLHHAHYKCTVHENDGNAEVVYIDRTHFHKVANVDDEAFGEFLERKVSVNFVRNGPATSSLLRFRVSNDGADALSNVRVIIALDKSFKPKEATHGSSLQSERMTYEFDAIAPAAERILEIRGHYESGVGETRQHVMLVKSNGTSILLQPFVDNLDEEARSAKPSKPEPAADPF